MMKSIKKRNTRSSTAMNSEISSNVSIATSSTHENIGQNEQVSVKRARTQRQIVNKKQSVNEPDSVLSSDEFITNQSVGEPTFATLEPVRFDLHDNIHDPPSSPSPLVIDTTEDIVCSQFNVSNCFQNQSNENYNPPRTPLGYTRTNNNSKYMMHSFSHKDSSLNINQKERPINSNTASTNVTIRTPTVDKNTSNSFSQISNRSIVVSADQFRRNSNEENIYNQRTSTSWPPHHEPISNANQGIYDDSFSIDSIPPETKNVLSRFPEFRHLVKAYKHEQQKCKTWISDYARLKRNYDRLEQNSFPRPSAPALHYLIDLVTHIQQSNGTGDSRSNEQLAKDLGVSLVILMNLKDITPQQTALNLFNYFYPGYAAKKDLDSINNLELLKPGLLETMLVFAQRAAPGVGYRIQDIRETLGNSIRGARFHFRKKINTINDAAVFLDNDNVDRDDSRRGKNQNTSYDNATDVTGIHMKEKYGGSTFDDNESL
ncbi:unnamed protein product [Rotaria sp. Silwood2]|nr:unnamed protein product [Rotaria sp. Silwood2]CAF2548296.1 unnamed protein product [Rotaria sp. Silwood2]CAF2956951.1 unnamed protein product [Rotaria sp. Silwood2]CAF4053431.1 unnamed protein product [Rotaria sp. Silwood2]CAF4365578.1 unnamed protein product [Rotaria sp. Silwood2]